jgi:hypothetical protein
MPRCRQNSQMLRLLALPAATTSCQWARRSVADAGARRDSMPSSVRPGHRYFKMGSQDAYLLQEFASSPSKNWNYCEERGQPGRCNEPGSRKRSLLSGRGGP